MKQYKYILDRSSKKFVCPKCNKKTFVKYIEFETRNYLNDAFGRCDRESNCSYHSTPQGEFKNTFETKFIEPPEPSFHEYSIVSQCGRNFKQNNLIQFLKTIFSKVEVEQIILKYLIGTSKRWTGATVFWQIDTNEKIRYGKIMLFNSETGKRLKNNDGKAYISSVRSILKLKKYNLYQCLFGLHLINETNKKTIALVEGEKTAIIMSVFKPEYVWLATGGLQYFSGEKLQPIKDFKIVAFPDKSEHQKWFCKAVELNENGFKIVVNDWLENTHYKDGTDLADVYIETIKTNQTTSMTNDLIVYTSTELAVHRIEQYNPQIRYLIDLFDLTDYYGNEIR